MCKHLEKKIRTNIENLSNLQCNSLVIKSCQYTKQRELSENLTYYFTDCIEKF